MEAEGAGAAEGGEGGGDAREAGEVRGCVEVVCRLADELGGCLLVGFQLCRGRGGGRRTVTGSSSKRTIFALRQVERIDCCCFVVVVRIMSCFASGRLDARLGDWNSGGLRVFRESIIATDVLYDRF